MKKAACRDYLQFFNRPVKPVLIVLSGPSGVGKDAVLTKLKDSDVPLEYITTLTTRPRRPQETGDVDYHFVSIEKFQEMISNSDLLEWAHVYGNWYGVPRAAVRQALDKGDDVIVKVDIQGAANIRKIVPQAIFIFLMPPSIEALFKRLKQRRTETPSDLALRLKTAEAEIEKLSLFDYVVVNHWDKVDGAVADIKAIITAEKSRVVPREIVL